jgi:uncharacterized protein with HEPN domain
MTRRNEATYLQDMLDAISQIQEYLSDLTYDRFVGESLYRDAIIRQMEIVGEAARCLTPDLRNRHADVPWVDVIGMRNRIAHVYFNLRLRVIWETATADLLPLKAQIERILADLDSARESD